MIFLQIRPAVRQRDDKIVKPGYAYPSHIVQPRGVYHGGPKWLGGPLCLGTSHHGIIITPDVVYFWEGQNPRHLSRGLNLRGLYLRVVCLLNQLLNGNNWLRFSATVWKCRRLGRLHTTETRSIRPLTVAI